MLEKIKAVFSEMFGGEPVIFRSPGRINILVEQISTACQKEMSLVLSV